MTVSRVSGEGLKMPAPSEAIIERMARASLMAIEMWNCETDREHTPVYWEELDDEEHENLLVGARACYASLACNAGAQVKIVKEPTS